MSDDAKYGSLRSHQASAIAIAAQYGMGQRPCEGDSKCVVAAITPGGGKTLLGSVYAHQLIADGMVDFVLVIVPRDALRSQTAGGFHDAERGLEGKLLADKKNTLAQRETDGSPIGYVTTYHDVVANWKTWERKMKRGRWLLILDEPHHLAGPFVDAASGDDPAWSAAVRPLYEAARFVLLMSGTLRRHDRQKIPFVKYSPEGLPIADLTYTREQALADGAVLPIDFLFMDGPLQWDRRGKTHAADLSTVKPTHLSDAIRTALTQEGYRDEWLSRALDAWLGYRATAYPSRAIVVCHRQEAARAVGRYIDEKYGVKVVVAVSDDPKAQRKIKAFRGDPKRKIAGVGDVLVTVGMAYEGLDVPDCTHLICLSNVTSEPWLEQAFARVTRRNPEIDAEQRAWIFVLDHEKMRAFVDRMKVEQVEPAIDRQVGAGQAKPRGPSSFISRDGEAGRAGYGVDGRKFTPAEDAGIERVKSEMKWLKDLPLLDLLATAQHLGWLAAETG